MIRVLAVAILIGGSYVADGVSGNHDGRLVTPVPGAPNAAAFDSGPLQDLRTPRQRAMAVYAVGGLLPGTLSPRPDFDSRDAWPPAVLPEVPARPVGTAGRLTDDQLRDLLCRPEFSWPCGWVLDLVRGPCPSGLGEWGESGGDPGAIGIELHDFDRDGVPETYRFVGLFQVWDGPLDPYANAQAAHRQYNEWMDGERSVSPWPRCSPDRPSL